MERVYDVLLTVDETVRRFQSALRPEESISVAKAPNQIVGELDTGGLQIRVQHGLTVRYFSYYLFGTLTPMEKGCRLRIWFAPHFFAVLVFILWSVGMLATTVFAVLVVLPSRISLAFKAVFFSILVISVLMGSVLVAHKLLRSKSDLPVLLGFLEGLIADCLIGQPHC